MTEFDSSNPPNGGRSTSQEILALLRQMNLNIDALRADMRQLTNKNAKTSEWVDADFFVAAGLAKTRDAVFRLVRLGRMPAFNDATKTGCFIKGGTPKNPRYRFHVKNTTKFLEGSPSGIAPATSSHQKKSS